VAAEIVIRCYANSRVDRAPGPALGRLASALDGSGLLDGPWEGLRVAQDLPANDVSEVPGPLTRDDLLLEAARVASDTSHVSTSSRLAVAPVGDSERDVVGVRVEAWGARYRGVPTGEWLLDGDSAVSLRPIWPFWARDADDPANAAVTQNDGRLEALFRALAENVAPTGLKLFDDAGLPFPPNAHAAYFDGPEPVLEDLAALRRLWVEGVPAAALPPLGSWGAADRERFHPWRDASEHQALWRVLSQALASDPRATIEDVQAVVESGDFRITRVGTGFVVASEGALVNSFMDRFYAAVLARADARG
jgi:hypothetical protein